MGKYESKDNKYSKISLAFLNCCLSFESSLVAINLIVQHIQDILNGDICKWQRGSVNGHAHGRSLKRGVAEHSEISSGGGNMLAKRPLLEPSTRPH